MEPISQQQAREILINNSIELSSEDSRSAQQYITELLVYIEALEEKHAERKLIDERYRSAQSSAPYFA